MKYLDKKEGSVFFIPLFLPKDIKDNNKSYYRYKFDKEGLYAFGRLIDDGEGAGDLIEVFNYTGIIPDDVKIIIDSDLMFKPFVLSTRPNGLLRLSCPRVQTDFLDKR